MGMLFARRKVSKDKMTTSESLLLKKEAKKAGEVKAQPNNTPASKKSN